MSDVINPYGSQDLLDEAPLEEDGKPIPVGKGLRFANLIIDYVAHFAIGVVTGIVIVIGWGEEGIRFLDDSNDLLIGIPIALAYYIVFESLTSRTVGKFVTGTKVVNEDGGKPSFGQILGRTFARFIPFEALSFLQTPARGWHDSLPRTYVVKSR